MHNPKQGSAILSFGMSNPKFYERSEVCKVDYPLSGSLKKFGLVRMSQNMLLKNQTTPPKFHLELIRPRI